MATNSDLVASPISKDAIDRLEKAIGVSRQGAVIEHDIDMPKRLGMLVFSVVFGVFGLWSACVPIDSAAHAQGQITVKAFKKPIQHYEGGIVKQVFVRDGDKVEAGKVLLELDNTQSLSQLEIYNTQLKANLALESRLMAERDKAEQISFPAELSASDAIAASEMAGQTLFFESRRANHANEVALLEQRIEQLQSGIQGLNASKQSNAELVRIFQDEVNDFQALLKEGFAEKTRLRELERNLAMRKGEDAQITTSIVTTQLQIGETRQQILQLKSQNLSETVGQLAETKTRISDYRDRVKALADIVARTEVRAPEAGIVNGLRVHTPGAVIPPGTVIAEVVPQEGGLIVEARVSPMDIDRVATGQTATVRMVALNARTVPNLEGVVTSLSADAIIDPATNMQFYMAQLEITPESLSELNGQALVPGMPTEVLIKTGARTFLQYLMKPLSDSVARSFRED